MSQSLPGGTAMGEGTMTILFAAAVAVVIMILVKKGGG